MITFLILAAIISIIVGIWFINKQQANDLKEANTHPFIDDLAPEVTPAPIAENMAKKKPVAKKKTTSTKSTTKKPAKKATKK